MKRIVILRHTNGNYWELRSVHGVLTNFTALSLSEAVDYVKNWISSFAIEIEINVEAEDKYVKYEDLTKIRVS